MRKYVLMLFACALLFCLVGMYPVSSEASESASAEISDVIYRYINRADGAEAEARTYDLGECFFADPVAFVRQLSLEAEDVQNTVVNDLPRSMRAEMHPKGFREFPDTVYSIQLTEEDTEETRDIVKALENGITKYWGISNPHTGDPIGIAALLMTMSGLGGAILWKKRRIVA